MAPNFAPPPPSLHQLREFAKPYVAGSLCGTSPAGSPSVWSLPFKTSSMAVSAQTGAPSGTTDGWVDLDSCRVPGKAYTDDYRPKFYAPPINHAHTNFRNCDGEGDYSAQGGYRLG